MLPSSYRPIANVKLLRLGSETDGGYWLAPASVAASEHLLSFGLSDNWEFEADFRRRNGARVDCYDHTVDGRFWLKQALLYISRFKFAHLGRYWQYKRFFDQPGVRHRLIKIGYDRPGETSLAALLHDAKPRTVFLKADIEGSEYRILDDVVRHRDKLSGLAIEFHDIDLHRDRLAIWLNGMDDFKVIALAANNFGGTDQKQDPLVVEITMVPDIFVEKAEADDPRPQPVSNHPDWPPLAPSFED